jgi:hypothetical protein
MPPRALLRNHDSSGHETGNKRSTFNVQSWKLNVLSQGRTFSLPLPCPLMLTAR